MKRFVVIGTILLLGIGTLLLGVGARTPSVCAAGGTCASTGVTLAVNPSVVEPGKDLLVTYQTPPGRPTTDKLVLVRAGTTTPLFPATAINGARSGLVTWTTATSWNGWSLVARYLDAAGVVIKESSQIAVQTCTTANVVKLQLQGLYTVGPSGTPMVTAQPGSLYFSCFEIPASQGQRFTLIRLWLSGAATFAQSFTYPSTSAGFWTTGSHADCWSYNFPFTTGKYESRATDSETGQLLGTSQLVTVQ